MTKPDPEPKPSPSEAPCSSANVCPQAWCYVVMGGLAPAILFGFFLVFGNDSYQYWADRYHIDLTNKYLFAHLPDDSLMGPLWREDTLAGYLWVVSLVTSPFAIDVLAGRLFQLSPLGIELVGTMTLYVLAVLSMFIYLRQALLLSMEAATAGAVLFAATAYWDYSLNTNPNIPMAVAWLPALLAMSHRLDASAQRRGRIALPFIGLVLLSFLCAIHSTVATLPITLLLVGLYAVLVLASSLSVLWVVSAVVVGVLLDAPFLWLFVEAAGLSHRNIGTGFYPQTASGLESWLTHGKAMVAQLALGTNRYWLSLVAVLGMVLWLCVGPRWDREQPRLRRIVLFAAGTWLAIFTVELFHEAINHAKRAVPLLRGWNVMRFADFAFFGLATVTAWMSDRALFHPAPKAWTPARRTALGWGLVVTAGLGGGQIAYAAYRMKDLPSAIYPQNVMLYTYLALYALVMLSLLAIICRFTRGIASGSAAVWTVTLVAVSVSLVTALHAYRSGLVKPQGIDMSTGSARIMTYAQRYEVPEDILAIKRLGEAGGRVVDLTRPLKSETWMSGSEITLYPLSGLRVLSGYSNLYPAWYGLLLHKGVNGKSGALWNILQVEDTDRTNFEVLPLLDVEYILVGSETRLPGYRAVPHFQSAGKTLYQVEEENRLGSAFLSPGFRCFASDEDALGAIHQATLPELRNQAILIASDPASVPLCSAGANSSANSIPVAIRTTRGRDRVMIEVENSTGGILTLSDSYYPGWRVLVNGTENPMLRTYTALRGVMLAPGRQSVEFLYAPSTFILLLTLSCGCLAGLLLLAGGLWLRDRTRGHPPSRGAEAGALTASRGI